MPCFQPRRTLGSVCVALALLVGSGRALPAAGAANESLDAAFDALWAARSEEAVASAVEGILATGSELDAVWMRLREGRAYSAQIPTGRQARNRYNHDGVEHAFVVHVPELYDPRTPYPIRVYLHGGVMRPRLTNGEWWRSEERWVRDDSIVVSPVAWEDSVWWQRSQIENLAGLLNDLKHDYNIDENRAYILGVSDGATGVYYHAFKATTPCAGFLAFIGHPAVLGNSQSGVHGDMHVVNLRGKPFFVVNGARDRLYPASVVEPYVRLFRDAGIDVDFRPQPDAGHDLSWWPEEQERIEAFIHATRREPLPDRLTWEAESTEEFNRAHWLVIDELGPAEGESDLDEFNRVTVPGRRPPLGINSVGELQNGAGLRILEVGPGSLADDAGIIVDDVLLDLGGTPTPTAEAAREVILGVRPGERLAVTVERDGTRRVLSLSFPRSQPGEARLAFPASRPSGRVDLQRTGNTVTASTRGVRRFRLLLSRDQFNFSKPVKVVTNGIVSHDAVVTPDTATLLRWASVDWDRSLLFDAELEIEVPPSH